MSRKKALERIEIVNEQSHLKFNSQSIKELIEFVLTKEKSKKKQVTLLVCDDKTMADYNKRYFKKNKSTDVIAFGMPEVVTDAEKDYLGDIVVSAQMAKRVAKKYKQTIQNEFKRYVVHGTLHLLGYEDESKEDYELMHQKQEKYLKDFIKKGD